MQTLPIATSRVKSLHTEAEQRRSDRLAELETICRYDRAGDAASIFTCERGLAASLQRRGLKPIRENRRNGRVESWIFEVPKSWVSVRPPRKLQLTQKQRQALSERAGLLKNHGLSPRASEEKALARG